MKKPFIILISCVVFCLSTLANAKPLTIIASFSILGDLVKRICQDHGNVETLVGPDSDTHVYEPTAQDAKMIAHADVIFINGLGFEGWIPRLLEASATQAPIFEVTQGIDPLPSSAKDPTPDPHAWSSPLQAKIYTQNIADGLCKVDPDNAAVYRENARQVLQELDDVIAWAHTRLKEVPVEHRKVITVHDGFNYLGRDFGLTFLSPVGVDTKSEPSARIVAQLIQTIRREKIKAVFVENITNPHLIEQIAKEAGVDVRGPLYSDALSEKSGPAPTYLAMIRYNLTCMIQALQSQ